MIKLKALTSNHISDIVHLILNKCKQANLIFPNLFDQIPIETNLSSMLDDFFVKNSGYGAFRNNELVSFLLGFSSIPHLKGQEQGIYIPLWGHYQSTIDDQQFFLLYRTLAQEIVNDGVFNHIITYLPNSSLLQEQLFTLGFGLLVIDAIRPLELISTKPLQSKFVVRTMTSDDFLEITQLETDFIADLQSSPTFLHSSPSDQSSPLSDFISDKNQTFVIEFDDKIVAASRGVLGSSNLDLLHHPQTIAINFAYTYPKFRGLGLGTHLVNEILKCGQTHQCTRCTVDFESANLTANRFWLSHFTSISFSAIRKIDNRF